VELLDRYLQAVWEYMPRGDRDDFVKELRDNILSQMEDRAAELGRPLNESELAEILKRFGHPLVVAAPYRRLPMQQLVGPKLFPLYWFAVQMMVLILFAATVVLAVVLSLKHGSVLSGLATAFSAFCLYTLVGVGVLTVCFGLAEYFGGGKIPFTETFNPLELPEVKKHRLSGIF
jgi:hypothetical protein